MKLFTRAAVTVLIASTLALVGCTAEPAQSQTSADDGPAAAKAHCEDTGGTVQTRQPTFNTNASDKSQWEPLGDPVELCGYSTLDDGTEIFVDLVTISSERPTLAALAYLAKPQVPDVPGNPATALCEQIGGAVGWGAGAQSGGLVLDDDDFEIIAPCTFADGSFIEEWGIAYYSDDTVRGKDLTEVFQFDQDDLPEVDFDTE